MNKLARVVATFVGAIVLASAITGVAAASNTNQVAADPHLLTIAARDLTDAEINGLLFMREEEKLARDVYTALYDQSGLALFANIARSEQTHMDAIKRLLDDYNLPDPVAGRDAGEYANQELQALYNQLTLKGAQSLVEALRVGATIEEIDIRDLQDQLASTDHPALQQLYQNLMRGSENHLRAFVTVLERRGGDYEPQYLDKHTYAEILDGRATVSGAQGRATAGQGRNRRQ